MERARIAQAGIALALGVCLACLGTGLVVQTRVAAITWEQSVFAGTGCLYALVGAVVLRHHARHLVGWLMLGIGVLVTTGYLAETVVVGSYVEGLELPGSLASLWYVQWYWLPFVYAQFVGLPLLFPTGRPLSPRWRRLGQVVLVLAVAASVGGMLAQQLTMDFDYVGGDVLTVDNPVGILPFDDIESETLGPFVIGPLFLGGLAGLASLVLRFRRSRGDERQQMKLGILGLAVTLAAFIAWAVLDGLIGWNVPVADGLTSAVTPVAMGLAITRYRLWDIDRLISRTLAYLVVTAVLGLGYAGLVVGVQGLGVGREVPDLVVAGATLAAAAVFRPLRSRAQLTVDRRFNRSRYDATRVLEQFGTNLRDEVDMDVLAIRVRAVVATTLHPSTVGLWLPRDETVA